MANVEIKIIKKYISIRYIVYHITIVCLYYINDFVMQFLVQDQPDSYTTVSYINKTSVDRVPAGSVIGGHTADGFPLYIVWSTFSGNLDIRNDFSEYAGFGDSVSRGEDWRYMVVGYSEFCP